MFTFARRLAWIAAFALPLVETWRRWGALWVIAGLLGAVSGKSEG